MHCIAFTGFSWRKRAARQSTSDLCGDKQHVTESGSPPLPGTSNEKRMMIIPSDDHFPFKCENCGGEFTDRLLLYDHIENCYPITCRYCPKIVCDYERLKVHVSWCHNSFISQCRYCLYISYGDAADIEAHRRKICPALGGLTCEHCPEEFPSFQTLGSHTCNRIVNFWNKCGYCAFRTYSIERLKSHHDAHFNEAAFF